MQFDVVIVGGSYAGLQAALTLGRACRSVLLVDDAHPRNQSAQHVHNFLGNPSPSPDELSAVARGMLGEYDVQLTRDRVAEVMAMGTATAAASATASGSASVSASAFGSASTNATWRVTGESGTSWTARAVVLATGLRDELPDVPGVAELWGRDVVACPHCHGWEIRGEPLGLLNLRGLAAKAVERAVLVSRWSRDVVLFTDGDELTDQQHARLKAAGVSVVTDRVRRLASVDGDERNGVELELGNGTRVGRRAVFAVVKQHQQTDLAQRIGCAVAADGLSVAAHAEGRTSVPGVWAAGTTAVPALLAIGAAAHGAAVALAIHSELTENELESLAC